MERLILGSDPIRGRGALGNLTNRFESTAYERDPDLDPGEDVRPDTVFIRDKSKSVVAYNDSPDVGFDASINPYRGCEHGCIYCYARPTHEYLGFSAGLDFETRIMVKEDAPELLRRELSASKWKPQPLGVSGVTDPYQPIERKLRLTRQCLEVLAEFRNPAVIITKNRLVARDIDVLKDMAANRLIVVFVSVTTLDLSLNRILEPRTSSPTQRLETISKLVEAGIPTGSLVAPIIPGLTDEETPRILRAVADAGARFASYVALRLPYAVAPLFEGWLAEHFPDRKDKVLNRIRSMRGGALNKSEFGQRMRGEGFFADQISSIFKVGCRSAELNQERPELSTDSFRVPEMPGSQMGLFSG